ncbi:MAG TPA: hypothetical protein VGD40_01570 [Chryseosolibacter sp.]
MAVNNINTLSGVFFTSLLTLFSHCTCAQDPHLKLENGRVWAKDLNAEVLYTFARYFNSQTDWESVFPVKTQSGADDIVIGGTYEVFETAVAFTPRFPFANNIDYLAMFHLEELARNTNEIYLPRISSNPLRLTFRLSPPSASPAEITAIYPTNSLLPENLLKIHITFSKPMTSGMVYDKLKLLDEENREVEKPFLVLDQELWDADMKTLTVLFDPGRIKRGLKPNLEMKPALREGERYTLVVQEGWTDIDGLGTRNTYTKKFRCTEPDRSSPSVASYKVHAPLTSAAPLIVELQESHDFILLSRHIVVRDVTGAIVEGVLSIGPNESTFQFVPKHPWVESKYTIEINPLLEDLAGNNLNRLFDEDLQRASSNRKTENRLNFTFVKKEG